MCIRDSSYTDDIIKLTETWQKERDEYPGWYIIPYNTAVELSMYTDCLLYTSNIES